MGSSFASSESVKEDLFMTKNEKFITILEKENFYAKVYCDIKITKVEKDGTLVIEIKRVYGYNIDCDKEQAKIDAIYEKKIGISKGDFRNIEN